MRLTLAVARHEWRRQWRTGRFRFGLVAFLLFCSSPPAVIFLLVRHVHDRDFGAATYLGQALVMQPFFCVLLAMLVAGNFSQASAVAELWSPLSSAGLGNSGFLFRRWLGILSLLLPLTLLPLGIAAGFALAAGHETFDLHTWLAAWSVRVLPLVVVASAAWLGAVTVAGSELGALFLGYSGLFVLRSGLNQLLLPYRMTLAEVPELLGVGEIQRWLSWTFWYWRSPRERGNHSGFSATEAPYDLLAAWEWTLPRLLLLAGLGLGLLAVASAFLGRTRRDLRPLEVRERHPLRTYLEMWNRLRQRRAPDTALGLLDRLAVLGGGLVALGALVGLVLWQSHFRLLAAERFETLTGERVEPMPPGVRPAHWSITGELRKSGSVRLETLGRLHNGGEEAVKVLAFTLAPELAMDELSVSGHRAQATRAWDRLWVDLEPPLAPGAELELRLRLAGVPEALRFGLRRRPNWSFVRRYQHLLVARFPRELVDFSRARAPRALSPRRIELQASHLTAVPRFTTWQLTAPTQSLSRYGQEVLPEAVRPEADLSLELEFPSEWLLADTCAHTSWGRGASGRLEGSCHTALSSFGVRGGALVAVAESETGEPGQEGERIAVAALPAHQGEAVALRASLQKAGALSHRAWPGRRGLGRLAVVEWPPPFDVDLRQGMRDNQYYPQEERLEGQLLLVPEPMMTRGEPLRGEDLISKVLARDLLERRRLAGGAEELVFRHLFPALMLRRMGLASQGASVEGVPWLPQLIRVPLLEAASEYHPLHLGMRLPAVLVEIESRAGSEAFYGGIDSFLSAETDEVGTLREMLAAIEARAGISLERMYQDYFVNAELPSLELEEVTSVRDGNRWRVEGQVRNTGTGEVICPVLVKTDAHEHPLRVTVDSGAATPFSVTTPSRPHTVLLDPGDTCHRMVTSGSATRERVDLLR